MNLYAVTNDVHRLDPTLVVDIKATQSEDSLNIHISDWSNRNASSTISSGFGPPLTSQ